jgi:hypothetical protein
MKIKFLILFILFCNIVYSQNKHDFLIGGGLGYQYSNEDPSLENSNFIKNQENLVQINPIVGYFITKCFVVGLGFEYLYDKTKFDDDSYLYFNYKENGFLFTPFLRLYTPFRLFLLTEFDYGNLKISYDGRPMPGPTGFVNTSSAINYNKIIGFSVGMGYSISINEYIAIEPSIRYLAGKYNSKDSENDFSRKGLLMNIGIVCFIN